MSNPSSGTLEPSNYSGKGGAAGAINRGETVPPLSSLDVGHGSSPWGGKRGVTPSPTYPPDRTMSTSNNRLISPGSPARSDMSGSVSPSMAKPPKKGAGKRPVPKSAKMAYMLHDRGNSMNGDFLNIVSDLNKQQQVKEKVLTLPLPEPRGDKEGGAKEAAQRSARGTPTTSGSSTPTSSLHGGDSALDAMEKSANGRGKGKDWSWRKLGFKKEKGGKEDTSDALITNLEERLNKAQDTASGVARRTRSEGDAAMSIAVAHAAKMATRMSVDSGPSLPPLRRNSSDFERHDVFEQLEPLEQSLTEEEEEDSGRVMRKHGRGPGSFSVGCGMSVLGEDLSEEVAQSGTLGSETSSENLSKDGCEMTRAVDNSLLAELEMMRKLAIEADRARLAAEEKAKKAMVMADQSVREVEEVQNKLREQENNARFQLATQHAKSALREAELARQVAFVESQKTELALVQAAKTWATIELEAKKRQDLESNASMEEKVKANISKYRQFTWAELEAATENFSPARKLGEGGFGVVYGGVLQHTPVAIKVLKNSEGMRASKEFEQEVEVLGEIHHPHVVMLLGFCPEKFCLVYEFMANGSLEDRLLCRNDTPPLPWYVRLRIAAEIASALVELHERPSPIIHRDIKPANVLLDKNFVARLADVGLAKFMPEETKDTFMRESRPVGTLAYVDPEFQRTGEFGPKSDVYAFGIVLLDMLTGRKPAVYEDIEDAVDAQDVERLAAYLDTTAGKWPLDLAMEVAVLAARCSEMRRKKRPSMQAEVMPALDKIRTYALAVEDDNMKKRGMVSNVPSCLICPITKTMMVVPVIAADGHTYEEAAIKVWLQDKQISPMTNVKLRHSDLLPNLAVATMIKEWKEKQG